MGIPRMGWLLFYAPQGLLSSGMESRVSRDYLAAEMMYVHHDGEGRLFDLAWDGTGTADMLLCGL